MKQSFARQHSRHRDRTPSVIYLPPPKPPITEKRALEIVPDPVIEPEVAIALPETPEPLVTERTEVRTPEPPTLNRQARRKALRAEAKAMRREGHAPVPVVKPVQPVAESAQETPPAPVVAKALPAAKSENVAPLPRARSLVAAKPRGLALVSHKLRRMFGIRPARAEQTESAIAGQLRALRSDLAALQQSIDRMIEGVAA